MADDVLAITWQVVDNGDFDHGVCSWLLFHAGTCNVDENLCREGGVVDLHVELEQLVVCRAAYALAYEVYAASRFAFSSSSTYTMRRCMPSPTGIVMESASLTPALDFTHTLCPMLRPGPKLV